MEENNIDINEMLATKFRDKLVEENIFEQITENDGDAIISFKIDGYGLAKKDWFTGMLKPELIVKAYLKTPDGTVLWKGAGGVNVITKETTAYKANEYVENPDTLRTVFKESTTIGIDTLIDQIKKR